MTLFWARTAQPPAVRPALAGASFASFHWIMLWRICYSTPTRKPVGRSWWENHDCLQFLLSGPLVGWFHFYVTGSYLLNANIPSAKDARYTLSATKVRELSYHTARISTHSSSSAHAFCKSKMLWDPSFRQLQEANVCWKTSNYSSPGMMLRRGCLSVPIAMMKHHG